MQAKETGDIDLIPGYFFRAPGRDVGWQFDHNFTDHGKWQKEFTLRKQPFACVVSGIGTGKSLGVGMGAISMGMILDDYKFLNIAQKQWQAQIMYNLVLEQARNTLMDKIIFEKPRRPHPKIISRYYIGSHLHEASMEFMSADRDATGILSWRGDEINIEEAGLFDNLDEIMTNLVTRLTGMTALGREYLGRLSLISNPWDNPYLWYLFDLASSDPENNLSLALATIDNKNITDRQLKLLLSKIPKEEQTRFLLGARPEGRGNYFSRSTIDKCEDPFVGEITQGNTQKGMALYRYERISGAGVIDYAVPPRPGRIYFVLGDPGTGAAPTRNAPVVMVWDVTEFPNKPIELVAFWWGNGFGAITPFTNRLLDWMGAVDGTPGYKPQFTGVDSTGAQTYFAQTLNIQYFSEEDDKKGGLYITGLDFSGAKKMGYLVTLRLFLEAGLMRWPAAIGGIRSQLANYEPERDRGPLPKLPQDIVATMAMTAWVIRSYYNVSLDDLKGKKTDDKAEELDFSFREKRGTDREKRTPFSY